MSLYDILHINKNATSIEIRKSYRKLALKYHPDKNKSSTATETFKNINTAYEILKNNDKRKKYDIMTNSEKDIFHKILKATIKILIFHISNSILKNNNMSTKSNNKTNKQNIKKIIYATLEEKYNNVYKEIFIAKPINLTLYVPLIENEVIFENCVLDNANKKTNLEIQIKCDDKNIYKIINKIDLLMVADITLDDYLYGGAIEFTHLDNNKLTVEFNSFIETIPIVNVKNKGLPYANNDGLIIGRGNLYIKFNIKNLNKL